MDMANLFSAESLDAVRLSVGAAIILAGAIFVVVGSVGVLRFPDFYTRMHAASVTDTLGATLILLGMMLLAGWTLVTFKLVMTWIFLLVTSPTASNAAAHAALTAGLEPLIGKWNGEKIKADAAMDSTAVQSRDG